MSHHQHHHHGQHQNSSSNCSNEHHGLEGHICNHADQSGTSQSLEEMSFERGIWGSVVNNNIDKLSNQLRSNSSLANTPDTTGFYPLHYAVRHSDSKATRILLEYGALPSVKTSSGQSTPLQRAAFCGNLTSCKLLIERDKSMIDFKDSDGMTALHKAYSQKHFDIVDFLVKNGSSTDIKDNRGRSPKDCLAL